MRYTHKIGGLKHPEKAKPIPPAAPVAAAAPATAPRAQQRYPDLRGSGPSAASWAWAAAQPFEVLTEAGVARIRRQLGHRHKRSFVAAMESILPRCIENDRAAWWLLLALPRLCLPSCPSDVDTDGDAYKLGKLCSMFENGHWQQLWEMAATRDADAARAAESRNKRKGSDARRFFSVKALIEVGEYKKGMQMCQSLSSVLEPLPHVVDGMRQAHPVDGCIPQMALPALQAARTAMIRAGGGGASAIAVAKTAVATAAGTEALAEAKAIDKDKADAKAAKEAAQAAADAAADGDPVLGWLQRGGPAL